MRPLENFYNKAEDILKRMNHEDALAIIDLTAQLNKEAMKLGREQGLDHANEMNRINNL